LYFSKEIEVSNLLSVSIAEEPGAKHRGGGTTGGLIWNSSRTMSALLAKDPHARRRWGKRRVLELGCGTGLLGITAACLGATVTLTDLPAATSLAERNVAQNIDRVSAAGGFVQVEAFDWTCVAHRQRICSRNYDAVLCSDLVFGNTDGWRALLVVLEELMRVSQGIKGALSEDEHYDDCSDETCWNMLGHCERTDSKVVVLFGFEERDSHYPSEGFWPVLNERFEVLKVPLPQDGSLDSLAASTFGDGGKKVSVYRLALR
jgi:SAM-dependent methyltransferase